MANTRKADAAARWIVTAIGQDRPGIVAGVTEVLFKLGCNLEDSAMTRLEGEYTIMLIVSAPEAVTAEKLHSAFGAVSRKLKLAVHVKALTDSETRAPEAPGELYMLSVYGADRAGIVYKVSQLLADAKANITDVRTHRTESAPGEPLYVLLLEIELPRALKAPDLEQKLKRLAKSLGVEVTLRASEAGVL